MPFLSFTGAFVMRDIGGGLDCKDSPITPLLPEGCSQTITYTGGDQVLSVVECQAGQETAVRAIALANGMTEV